MGRGDTKTARGKISKGSFGKYRPRKKNKNGPKKEAEARKATVTSR